MDSPESNAKDHTRASLVFWAPVGALAAGIGVLGFWLGSSLGAGVQPVPTPTPTPSPVSTTSLFPGPYSWTELLRGSCLETFTNAWQEVFDVVPCTVPHAAQVIRVGQVPGFSPTMPVDQAAISRTVLPLCTELGVVDDAVAVANPTLVYTFTYPATPSEWRETAGHYACFASTSDGAPLVGSLVPVD